MAFDPLLPYETWSVLGARIAMHSSASSWWLGDWLVFGKVKYGRRYKEAIAATGLDYQTLRNYAVVARRFEASRRRETLTFQHHAEVCALGDPEQDRWLDLATTHGWSKNELRRQLRAARATRSPLLRSAEVPVMARDVRLTVTEEADVRWRAAAARSGCEFEAWAIRVLDGAARFALAEAS